MYWQHGRRPPTRSRGLIRSITDKAAIVATTIGFVGRALRQRVGYLIFLGIVGGAVAEALLGSTFQIDEVDVAGALLLDRTQVATASGLRGQNPFLVDTSAARQRVLALGVPERVSIWFQLPNVAIVQVAERRPAYIWKVDPTMYLVARDGTVLGPTDREAMRVIVVDGDHRPIKVGDKVEVRPLEEADYLIHVLPGAAGLSPRYVLYTRQLGIVVPAGDGIQIAFGDSDQLAAKVQVLGPTLQAARRAQPRPSLVDVQVPQRPYFR